MALIFFDKSVGFDKMKHYLLIILDSHIFRYVIHDLNLDSFRGFCSEQIS